MESLSLVPEDPSYLQIGQRKSSLIDIVAARLPTTFSDSFRGRADPVHQSSYSGTMYNAFGWSFIIDFIDEQTRGRALPVFLIEDLHPHPTSAFTWHETQPHIQRGTMNREEQIFTGKDEHRDMIKGPVMRSTSLPHSRN